MGTRAFLLFFIANFESQVSIEGDSDCILAPGSGPGHASPMRFKVVSVLPLFL